MSKTCTRCGETKPLDEYHRDKRRGDGRRADCKECVRERNRRYREENRDKRRAYNRRYREENRDGLREYKRRYYEGNRDKILKYDRRYHEENRDIINQEKKMRGAQYTRASNLLASKKGAPYSPQEDALILADNGMTMYQKAIELGRTYDACAGRRKYLHSRAHN